VCMTGAGLIWLLCCCGIGLRVMECIGRFYHRTCRRIDWYWYVRWRPRIMRMLAVVSAVGSSVILYSELVLAGHTSTAQGSE
jgi:hypothetical protein